MQFRYFRPLSVSWWSGAVPLVAGSVKAMSEAFDQLEPAVRVIDSVTGGLAASVMISFGAAAIGLKDAIARDK